MSDHWKFTAHALSIIEATEGLSCPEREYFLRGYNAFMLGSSEDENPYDRKRYASIWLRGHRLAAHRPLASADC